MLPDLLFQVVGLFLDAALASFDLITPDWAISSATDAVETLLGVLRFAPITAFLALVAFYFAVDIALNWYSFVVETYRLVPGKFT